MARDQRVVHEAACTECGVVKNHSAGSVSLTHYKATRRMHITTWQRKAHR